MKELKKSQEKSHGLNPPLLLLLSFRYLTTESGGACCDVDVVAFFPFLFFPLREVS